MCLDKKNFGRLNGFMSKPTKAMVLGAGFGTRMRPLTDHIPKPLVELDGRPLIDHVLDRLSRSDVKDIVVNVHYLADKLEAHLQGARDGRSITISDERDVLLDTGGGVKRALGLLGDEPFFIHNSDSVWIEGASVNLSRMAQMWDDEKMDCLLLLALSATSVGYKGFGDFAMDPRGRVSRRKEREVVPFVHTGVCIVHPRLFAEAPDGPFSMNLLWDKALENDRLFGLRHDGIWMHVGDPSALEAAEERWRSEI